MPIWYFVFMHHPIKVGWLLGSMGKKVIWERCLSCLQLSGLVLKPPRLKVDKWCESCSDGCKKMVFIASMSWTAGLCSIFVINVTTILTITVVSIIIVITTIITTTTLSSPSSTSSSSSSSSSSTLQVAMSCDSDDLAVRWGWSIYCWCIASYKTTTMAIWWNFPLGSWDGL